MNPDSPALAGLDWPPPPGPPAFVLRASGIARDGQSTDVSFLVVQALARHLLGEYAEALLDSLQAGILGYIRPLGVDPATVTWTCHPAAFPEPS